MTGRLFKDVFLLVRFWMWSLPGSIGWSRSLHLVPDSAVLPPSGRAALPESDPELTAMLARAAKSVGAAMEGPSISRTLKAGQLVLGSATRRSGSILPGSA